MSERRPPWPQLCGWVVVAAVGAGLAIRALPTGPPSTMLYAVPPFLFGLYLAAAATWMQRVSLYGRLTWTFPRWAHWGVQGLGVLLIAASVVFVAQLPGREDRAVRQLAAREVVCEDTERLHRDVLPTLEQLHALAEGPRATEADRAIRSALDRCVPALERAFARPEGTHISWRRLRDWITEHPEFAGDSPVLTAPHRPLQRTRTPRAVDVDL